MKISLTGASGFIGNHLVTALWDAGHDIVKWDRKSGRDIKDWELEDCDFVIHLAAIANVRRSIKYPEEYWQNNVEYTKRIQRICFENQVPLVYASSSCIHSWYKSPYGTSKKVNEATAFPGQVGLRFTTVYGEGARESMFMTKLLNGKLEYYTNSIRDFIHVDDVIRAIMLFVDTGTKDKLPAYDVGTGTGNFVSSLAKMKYGRGLVESRAQDCEAHDNTADNSALRALGWEPKINVKDYILSH